MPATCQVLYTYYHILISRRYSLTFTEKEQEVQGSYGICPKTVKQLLGRSRMPIQEDVAPEFILLRASI